MRLALQCQADMAALDAEIEPLPLDAFLHLPDMFIEQVQDGLDVKVILSTWGQLVWSRAKPVILAESLLNFPHLDYAESFQRAVAALPGSERAALQERLGRVAASLMAHQGDPTSHRQRRFLRRWQRILLDQLLERLHD